MHALGLASALLLALVTAQGVNFPDPYRPCGFKIAPCPADMYCQPDEPTCTDLNRCPGVCVFRNTYASCGGFRIEPLNCVAPDVCVDDPRNPSSCGMACDAPGICLPPKPVTCGGCKDKKCPRGLFCYKNDREDCQKERGKCLGVCL